MSIDNLELTFEIVYLSEDLLQVEIKASNGRFAGTTTFYTDTAGKELAQFAEKLRGFPKAIGQTIRQEFGYAQNDLDELKATRIGLKTSAFYARLDFISVDKKGHTAVDVILLEDNWTEREEARGKASFELDFDPASLDQFVQELIEISESKTGKATLRGNLDNKDVYG
jgi:hypothetical protein